MGQVLTGLQISSEVRVRGGGSGKAQRDNFLPPLFSPAEMTREVVFEAIRGKERMLRAENE